MSRPAAPQQQSHKARRGASGSNSRRPVVRVEAVAATETKQAAGSGGSKDGNSVSAPTTAPSGSMDDAALASAAGVASMSSVDGASGGSKGVIMAAKINAVASKINAARELARRLSEEKQAAAAKTGVQGAEAVRNAEEASAAAAAQAARADALARALRKAESTREQLQRLKAENEALKELLLELAADKATAQTRLAQVAEGSSAAAAASALSASASSAPPISRSAPVAPVSQAPLVLPGTTTTTTAAPPAPSESLTSIEAAAVLELITEPPTITTTTAPPAQAEPVAPGTLDDNVAAPDAATAAGTFVTDAPPGFEQSPPMYMDSLGPATAYAPTPAPPPPVAFVEDAVPPPPAPPAAAAPPAKVAAPAAPPAAAAPQVAAPPAPAAAAAPVVEAPPAVVAPPAPAVETAPAVPKPQAVPAPRGVLQERAKRQDEQVKRRQADIAASIPQLQQLAAMATQAGQNVFTLPPQPVQIDGPVRLFYNRAQGPLPSDSAMVVKVGLNKWDIVMDLDMKPVDYLPRNQDQHWWEVTLDLPSELFRVDFVLYDKHTQQYDNNNSKDYRLELTGAPTEQQLLELRLEGYRMFEMQRMAYLEYENSQLWQLVEEEAQRAASEARVQYRKERETGLRAEAQALVTQRRKVELSGLPVRDREPGVYAWTTVPKAGQKAFFAYNKGRGPLANSNSARLHIGYDGWWNQIKQVYDLVPMSSAEIEVAKLREGGAQGNHSWYGCWVEVPHSGMVLDFVLSDRDQATWDNNAYQDYHTRVQGAHSAEQLCELLYAALKKEGEQRDKEMEEAYARRAYLRVTRRGEALRKRRAALNEFLYTAPFQPVAGQKVEVYYNAEHTPLRGRPNIYLRYGFNRWAWNQQQNRGALSVKMEPTLAGGIGFYMATIDVPKEAWGVDMVFIDTDDPNQGTGFFDNNGGLDYHLPVRTSDAGDGASTAVAKRTNAPMKIVHVSVEMAPIAKVGGMGDVVTALGRAVQEEGHQVEVILPKYDCIDYKQVENLRQEGSIPYGGTTVRVWRGVVEGLPTTFLEPENGHFWRGCIYGRNDDHVRFGFHCGAALAYLAAYNVRPTVLHCHDWPTAPIAWGQRGSTRCVFTIHNLSYGADLVGRAMASCEVATTVSPTYAKEVSGNPAVAPHLGKLYGIRNGIDTDVWNPGDDEYLPRPYGPEDAVEGKEAARKELRQRLGLSQIDVPIVSCVTRLVAQKGIHLIKHAAWRTVERGGQFVLLGSAPDGRVQAEFNALRDQLKTQYHDRAALVFTYDEPLSHLIYAGSDMFLVPSMFEPCGLTQMIAMQYGTVPVVRKTGGLADTVFDVDHDEERALAMGMEPNGFTFESVDAAGMDYALNRAMSMWYSDRAGWRRLVSTVMRQDWSWFSPSLDYIEIYYRSLR